MVPKSGQKVMVITVICHLKKAKIPRETATTTATTTAMMMKTMATSTMTTLKTKEHSLGFVMITKNGQKVMAITVICLLKSRLTFVHAPCTYSPFRVTCQIVAT